MSQTSPLVSVNMCVYNAAPYLTETIESILTQTFSAFEFVIVNDGSLDDSGKIIEQYAKKDKRIRLLTNRENTGMSNSRNLCLAHSSGKYIAIQDADDISLPYRLEKQVSFFEDPRNQSIAYCGAWLAHFGASEDVSKYPDRFLKEMQLSNCMFGHPSTMFRRELVENLNFSFKEEFDPANDYALQAALVPYIDFANIQEILVKYRQHATNASNNQTLMLSKAKCIRETQFERLMDKKLSDSDKETINDFFVIYQGTKKPNEIQVLSFIDWMKMIIEKGSSKPYYTRKGLTAVFAHFYFKLFLRQRKLTISRWYKFFRSGFFIPLFLTYSLRDVIHLLRHRDR